ncbi:MAG: polyprenol monophosphomannose synthase [Chloroflexi bacterium]|nr:polyprenol monophosphomannose synthase [Chloroflexota bacterium]
MPNLTVVLPTYNEAENLELMVEALLALNIEDLHVLIVDDNSPDGTGEIADELAEKYIGWVNVQHNPGKSGLGPAYRIGISRAIEEGADLVLQMDTDFSHQPPYIPSMIEALYEREADMVLGSRYVKGGSVDERWGIHRKLLSFWANRIYVRTILGLPINDATGGFRLWRREALLGLGLDRINSSGYVYLVELAFVAHKLGYRLTEVPSRCPDRERGTSKMDTRVMVEAALRVWQILFRHRKLTPADRLPETLEYSE